ncbi:adenylosuccinate lyase family protein [uncultured Enterovirga sp.]|uniref:class-II fumarase/aspartase family protein n=1 Tax=uncultured Enterovirga sp. TaxID=2026352 RepID=UPI0035CAB444
MRGSGVAGAKPARRPPDGLLDVAAMTFSALDSRLLGPLFATETMREVFSDRARLAAMLAAEVALARAEALFGLVPEGLAAALDAIDPDTLDFDALGRGTALAGVPTIPFVKAVGARLPPELEAAFHKGATTQDIVDTALALQMRRGLDLVAADADAILAALTSLAERHRATPQVGRTYGQQAQPLSFGFTVAVWAAGIAEVAAGLPALREAVLRASLGGPVGTLAALGRDGPAVADAFAEELGLAPAPVAWHTRRASMLATGAFLASLVGALGKMATDVADLCSTEIGEVAEPHLPGRGGSSAMPHKRNPVSATVILSAHAAAPGHLVTLAGSMAAAHGRPAGAWHAEWHALPSLFGLASGALAEARRLAEGLVVDPERMRRNLDATRGLLFADAVAARLTASLGRAGAHAMMERLAGRVREAGVMLREAVERDPDFAGRFSSADLDAAFDPGPSVAAAAGWIDRVTAEVARVRATLT